MINNPPWKHLDGEMQQMELRSIVKKKYFHEVNVVYIKRIKGN